MNILSTESFCKQKTHNRTLLFGSIILQARSPFWLLKPISEHVHARLLPRLSWSWTVLLPSDTRRKPIKSITTVLLPFVTYLLTLHRIIVTRRFKAGKVEPEEMIIAKQRLFKHLPAATRRHNVSETGF
jgi:hypothetical protein